MDVLVEAGFGERTAFYGQGHQSKTLQVDRWRKGKPKEFLSATVG